eukprot:GFUD01024030.1.p1 GENE.GFUD01024030.1~~GFUD01024030.1.p1  ORF type:complete len:354 (-),score=75.08 GFUD01024030.1:120-1121(-)
MVMYQLHHADRPVLVPVPPDGCLSLEHLRHHFPEATGLHYVEQNHLVSVCQSYPIHPRGMLLPRKAVFHLPDPGLVTAFIVTCGDLLPSSSHRLLALADQYKEVLECIDVVNKKLSAKQMNVDCVRLVINDLKKFEQMLDETPDIIQETFVFGAPSNEIPPEPVEDREEKEPSNLEQIEVSVTDITSVIQTRPKIVKKTPQKLSQSPHDRWDPYGFSDHESDKEKIDYRNNQNFIEDQKSNQQEGDWSRLDQFRKVQMENFNTGCQSSRPRIVRSKRTAPTQLDSRRTSPGKKGNEMQIKNSSSWKENKIIINNHNLNVQAKKKDNVIIIDAD